MESAALLRKAATYGVTACILSMFLIFSISPSAAQQMTVTDVRDAGKAFIGTWESARTNLCSPCILKVESIAEGGAAMGTLTTNPDGTKAFNGSVKLKDRKVVLGITAPRGTYIEFDLPKAGSNKIYGTFPNEPGNRRELAFTRQ